MTTTRSSFQIDLKKKKKRTTYNKKRRFTWMNFHSVGDVIRIRTIQFFGECNETTTNKKKQNSSFFDSI